MKEVMVFATVTPVSHLSGGFRYNCRHGSQPGLRNEMARPVREAWELWKL